MLINNDASGFICHAVVLCQKKKKSRKENYDQSNAQCLTFSIFLTKEDLKNKMFCFLMEKDNRFSVWLRAVQDRHVWLLRFYYISLD